MEVEIIAVAGPFYVLAVALTGFWAWSLAHKAMKMDQSADETATTEKVNPSIVPK